MTTTEDHPSDTTRIHATAFAVANQCVVIRGPSGAGKSDLTLRCLGTPPSNLSPIAPILVADDQIIIERKYDALVARAPDAIFGKLEVRGLGVLDVPAIPAARIRLVCELVSPDLVPRMPDRNETVQILGISVPSIRITPFESSAPLKVLMKLSQQLAEPSNDNLIT